MRQVTKTAFSFTFFLSTVFVSVVTVQGGWGFFENLVDEDGVPFSTRVSMVSQNFDSDVGKSINRIISSHQDASYVYLLMASHFSRADMSLPGFSKYFRGASERQLGLAEMLAQYLTKRGEHVGFMAINSPDVTTWDTGLAAMEASLEIEKSLNRENLELEGLAESARDPHLKMTIEDGLLGPSVDLIKDLGDKVAVLERMTGPDYGLAEYIFDKSL